MYIRQQGETPLENRLRFSHTLWVWRPLRGVQPGSVYPLGSRRPPGGVPDMYPEFEGPGVRPVADCTEPNCACWKECSEALGGPRCLQAPVWRARPLPCLAVSGEKEGKGGEVKWGSWVTGTPPWPSTWALCIRVWVQEPWVLGELRMHLSGLGVPSLALPAPLPSALTPLR